MNSQDVHELLRRRYAATSPGNGPRYVLAPEVRNRAGFSANRAADLLVMDTWESGPVRLIGHEVKVSRSDWLRELKDPSKAEAFIPHVSEWWLVVGDPKIVKDGELPEGWGLLAPAGDSLRAIVKAKRKPQTEIPTTMLAALMRSVYGVGRAELEKAKQPKPHDLNRIQRMGTYDDVPRESPFGPPLPKCEIQRVPYRHAARRSA